VNRVIEDTRLANKVSKKGPSKCLQEQKHRFGWQPNVTRFRAGGQVGVARRCQF